MVIVLRGTLSLVVNGKVSFFHYRYIINVIASGYMTTSINKKDFISNSF